MSTIVKWGLITSMVYITFSLVSNLLGIQQGGEGAGSMGLGMLFSFLQFVATFFTIYLGIKETRDEDLGGYLTLSQAFKAGLKIAFIAGLIAGLFTFIYMQFIDPDMADRIMSASEEQMDEMGVPEENREMSMKFTNFMTNPIYMAAFLIIWVVFWGMIKALVAGMILKKDPPITVPTAE